MNKPEHLRWFSWKDFYQMTGLDYAIPKFRLNINNLFKE